MNSASKVKPDILAETKDGSDSCSANGAFETLRLFSFIRRYLVFTSLVNTR